MTTLLNPFPDYAVTRLSVGQSDAPKTIETSAILKGRELVERYVQGLATAANGSRTNAALCAIRGDYGTGKTHLLNDAAAHLQERCKGRVVPSILRATCIEADPLGWFRMTIGPQLDALPLYEVILQLYSRAGQQVARATVLTESAAEVLAEDPGRIRNLIRENHISVDEVGREFEKQLGVICKNYDQTIRRVLARLVSSETANPAREWLRGETLVPRKAELLGIAPAIESAEQASAVIGAVAALHKAAGRPFLVQIDELEHFVRYDVPHHSWGNMTWLKRLLEQLGEAGALALVAGHWSAWETTKDYLDRFPQYAPIDLVKLGPAEVLKIVRERVPQARLDEKVAQVIANVTDGNMRRVMSLCNLLFRQSEGFSTELNASQVHGAWTAVAQRIPPEQALEQIADLLISRGFAVATTSATFRDIPFDLVGEAPGGRVVLVDAKHSVTQSHHYVAARQFIDKLASVVRAAPTATGIFLSNGSIDDELLGLLRASQLSSLRWFDLTDRDVMDDIRAEIDRIDGRAQQRPVDKKASASPQTATSTQAGEVPSAIERETEKLRAAMNADFERRLRELEERRKAETVALQERLDELSKDASSPRTVSLRKEAEINPDRARASYEALLEWPSLNTRLGYLGIWLVAGLTCIAVGLLLYLGRYDISINFGSAGPDMDRSVGIRMTILAVVAFAVLLLGIWLIWRRYSQVAHYFDFSRQTIRDLYLRDVPIGELTRVNTILRRTIERDGVVRARKAALKELQSRKKEFSTAFQHYVSDLEDPRL